MGLYGLVVVVLASFALTEGSVVRFHEAPLRTFHGSRHNPNRPNIKVGRRIAPIGKATMEKQRNSGPMQEKGLRLSTHPVMTTILPPESEEDLGIYHKEIKTHPVYSPGKHRNKTVARLRRRKYVGMKLPKNRLLRPSRRKQEAEESKTFTFESHTSATIASTEKDYRTKHSIAIVMSGLDTRLVKEAVDSLVDHVIEPHVQAGFIVDVFAVLQKQNFTHLLREIDRSGLSTANSVERISAIERYLKKRIETSGGSLIKCLREIVPHSDHIRKENNLDLRPRDGTWIRNLLMFHNIKRGFDEARAHANYTYYVRTRTDNVFFRKHPLYSTFTKEAILPSCRRFGGYNDKFIIFKSKRSSIAFSDILQNAALVNAEHLNSEKRLKILFAINQIPLSLFSPEEIMVSHTSLLPSGETCYRSFHRCVTPLIDHKIRVEGLVCPVDNIS